ncbi:C4-dicarboxylate TRAP transporter substrate-binding protein [Paenalcaligenes niemegkensis]|uniref:C4-dicarboxylate TRAP transporter substrate-binding protein n=1 Tax=Paenalcaligenes niemegkensis TaxID=2895469 RepID=UPI001EE85881|nr:C4-dicarboxylate TRAP transporter substrate-binding protein [Paenalcaligenes niemegkensis]MCQ9618104.1 C4-dicarboxylate TRAP transporter substrate-binding protein [Paenalcaligenes niemegkensis]
MNSYYRRILSVLAVSSLAILAACSSEDKASADTTSADTSKTYSINVAYGNQPGEPIDQLAHKWKQLVEEKSEGKVSLKLYPSSQLGSEQDVVEQARMGNNVIILAGYGFLMNYVADAGIFDTPYLVDNFDQMIYLTSTDWYKDIAGKLREKKLDVLLPAVIYGERHLMTKRPVLTPADLNGMKVRVPNTQIAINTFTALGASPTPTPLSDLYTSLQQGLVDGAENPLPVLQGVKTQEVAKHLSLTGHQKFILAWVAGTDYMASLPEDVRQLLEETGIEARDYGRQVLEDHDKAVLESFKADNVTVHEVDQQLFKDAVSDVYGTFPTFSPNLYDTVQSLLAQQ